MSDDKKQISKCPPPIEPLRGGYISPGARTLHRGAWKHPSWNFWKYMPEVETWQACALALNFDPDSLERSPDGWMSKGLMGDGFMGGGNDGDVFQRESFPSDEVMRQHENLLRVLAANRCNAQFFTPAHNYKDPVRLSEFAAWCAPVVRDLTGGDIPEELAALAKAAPQAAAKVEAAPHGTPAAKVEAVRGIDKREVMAAFNGLKWDFDHWGKNLASPSDKLKACRVALGSKTASALWNPADIGVYLLDEVPLKKLDAVFVGLSDWLDEWREKTTLERD